MRRSLSCIAVLGLTLLLAMPAVQAQTVPAAPAQAAAPAVPTPTVAQIVARNLQAKGGEEKMKETTSVRMTGKATIQGMSMPLTSLAKRPFFMHNEMEMAGQKMVQGFDGTTMWVAMGGMPPQAVPDGPQIEWMKQNSTFDPIFLDYAKKGHTITFVGRETDGGKPVNHLLVTTKGGMVFHYYLDAETGLESKFSTTTEMEGMKAELETRMSDYRTVEGRTVPFRITTFMNGNQMGEMNFEKIEFNVPLDDAIFKIGK